MSKNLKPLRIEKYATTQVEALLERFAWQVRRTAKSTDPESVRALRVDIRHLANCLHVFKQFFPDRARQKIQRQMRSLKQLAGEVRNRDIALEVLVVRLEVQDDEVTIQLIDERDQAKRELGKFLRRWRRQNLCRKWRGALEL